MVELLHNAIKAERQVQEDNKYAKTKAYFASKTTTNAQPSSISRFQNASKAPLKQDKENPKPRPAPTANSSMASMGSSKINCYKCGGKGHKSFECPNSRVMYINENGDYESMSEGECEAIANVALATQDDDNNIDEALLCAHDNNPTLVVTKVLTTQPQAN